MAGELGALAAGGGRRMALLVGAAALVGFGIGVADSSALANAEHLLGFGLGALTYVCLDRYMPQRRYAPE
jgi:membrane associated rhomboid family serine protease